MCDLIFEGQLATALWCREYFLNPSHSVCFVTVAEEAPLPKCPDRLWRALIWHKGLETHQYDKYLAASLEGSSVRWVDDKYGNHIECTEAEFPLLINKSKECVTSMK